MESLAGVLRSEALLTTRAAHFVRFPGTTTADRIITVWLQREASGALARACKVLAMSSVNESLAHMFCHARAQTWMNLQGSFYQTHGGKARQQKASVSGATEKRTHALRQRRGPRKLLRKVVLFNNLRVTARA